MYCKKYRFEISERGCLLRQRGGRVDGREIPIDIHCLSGLCEQGAALRNESARRVGTKKCSYCGRILRRDEFTPSSYHKDFLKPQCRECSRRLWPHQGAPLQLCSDCGRWQTEDQFAAMGSHGRRHPTTCRACVTRLKAAAETQREAA